MCFIRRFFIKIVAAHSLFFTLLLAFFCAVAANASPGAWTQKAGNGQFILSSNYGQSSRFFNHDGNLQPQPRYRKTELNPYAEYGLTDALTIGGTASLQQVSQQDNANFGIGNSELFLRQRLWQKDGLVLSVQPMVGLPSPYNRHQALRIGEHHPELGIGLLGGYGFEAMGEHHFAELALDYRHRFSAPKDQIKLAATLGAHLTPTLMILPQAFFTTPAQDSSMGSFTQSAQDDYTLLKLQLSTVYSLNPTTAIQLGGYYDVSGKNAGAGRGILLAYWVTF